jgi:hypothetical protein
MDLNANGIIIGDANENIFYNYDGSQVTRSVNCVSGGSILGGVGSGTNVVNNAAGIPLFRYYDRQDNLIAAANLDAQIPNIRRINITLVVDNEISDPGAAGPRRMIYSTNVIVRNHALSP